MWRFGSLSEIALAELALETQNGFPMNIWPQSHPSPLDEGDRLLVIGDSYEPLITS